jgi:hypothetical protein
MNELWIFFILVIFCIYVLLGLHITAGIDSFIQILLTWIIYTIMCSTFLNVFLLGYFWSVVHNKRGPTGLRGPMGERGQLGLEGKCALDLVEAYLIKELMQFIDDLYYAGKSKRILNQTTYTIPCTYVNNKIAVMAGSRQYKTIYKNLYINYKPELYDTPEFNTDTQQTDTKPIQTIISYLKNIWREWFNLIYNATAIPGEWFNDPSLDADENYNWLGNVNPFDEIRKYDVYYWGLTRNFRPLKAEICRANDEENAKLPIINQILEPRLKIIETNDYYRVGDSEQSGSRQFIWNSPNENPEASWWCPNKVSINSSTYYPIGDVMKVGALGHKKIGKTFTGDIQYDIKNDNGPDMKTILVAGDVVDPLPPEKWPETHNVKTNHGTRLYKPVCPAGYTSLGDVTKSSIHPRPSDNEYKCLPTECLEKVADSKVGYGDAPLVWNRYNLWYNHNFFEKPYGWRKDWQGNINSLNSNIEVSGDTGYSLVRAGGGDPFYKIKESCLRPPQKLVKTKTKPLEPEFEDLGIGWYGHPYKLDPKYSIFSFLHLAPEGLVVHSGTGRRYYVIHYGGEESDIYIFLTENNIPITTKYKTTTTTQEPTITQDPMKLNTIYTKAIQTDSDINKTGTNIRDISRKDKRQQWRIKLEQNDKKYFKMENIFNGRNLNIDLEPILGYAVYTTISNADSVNYLFSFIPAFGTHLNNVEKP